MDKRTGRGKLAKADFGSSSMRQPISLPSGGGDSYANLANIGWQQAHLHDAEDHWRCYRENPWVRSCVDLIAQAATADKYSVKSEDKTQRQALETVLEDIAPRSTFDRLLRTVYRDLEIDGNCYLRVMMKNKTPVALHRVDFRQIVPELPDDNTTDIKYYSIYTGGDITLTPIRLPARQMIHLTLNDHGENGTGLSPLESLDDSLSLAVYATKFQKGFFKNGVKAGDVYATDGQMDPDTYDRDKQYLISQYTQPDQAFSPLFLSGAWKLVGRGQELRKDGDFLQLLVWLLQEIASVYSVPLGLLSTVAVGALGANGKEQDRLLFLNQVISPLQKQVLEDFNQQLLVDLFGNKTVRLEPPGRSALKLDDITAAKILSQAGATLNEVRAVLNLASIDGGDVPLFFQPGATLFGVPGTENSVIITAKGAFPGTPGHPLSPLMHQDDVLNDPREDDEADVEDRTEPKPAFATNFAPYNYDPNSRAP